MPQRTDASRSYENPETAYGGANAVPETPDDDRAHHATLREDLPAATRDLHPPATMGRGLVWVLVALVLGLLAVFWLGVWPIR